MIGLRMFVLLSAVAIGTACQTYYPVYEYQLNEAILADAPARAAGQGVRSADTLGAYPEIRIDPTGVGGYENLPDSIRELYETEPMPIALGDVINQLLANSRDIKIEGYTVQIAEYQIPISKSIYDLLFQASASMSRDETLTPPFYSESLTRERRAGASLSQQLPTGAVVALIYEYSRQKTRPTFSLGPLVPAGFGAAVPMPLDPVYTHSLRGEIRQPLLRGFGPLSTNAEIHIAQLDRNAAAADFEMQVQDQVRRAVELYWDLVAAVNSYNVQVIAYTAAADLLRINTAKVEVGVMARTQVLQAQASVEARREAVIRAKQRVRNLEDTLKQLLFFQAGAPNWGLELRPTQELVWREVEIQPDVLLHEALSERPEVRAAMRRLEGRDINVEKSRRDQLPQLDAIASVGVLGMDDSSGDAFDDMADGDLRNYAVGLEFSFPLQNRQRRFLHRQAISRRDQANEALLKQADLVTLDVRLAVRELQTARERIEITRSRVESEAANLEAENKRLEVGVSTSFEVLQFQDDLAAAQEAHIQAIVDYNKATVALERARGTLLRAYGIAFVRPDLRSEEPPVLFPVGWN